MPCPGQVYYLPPEEREGPNKGDRPHLAVSLCDDGDGTVTFVYGSTQSTDAKNGAANVLVNPFATTYRRTGLDHPTYFYPSRLISLPGDAIPEEPAGLIMDEMPAIRNALKIALGFGQGVTAEANVTGSNRRGRVVGLREDLASEYDTPHAIVVTDPSYSRRELQQTLIPLFDADDFEGATNDVIVQHADWVSQLRPKVKSVLIAVPFVFTVYAPDYIVKYGPVIVDAETMRQVEVAMALHFGL
jgi:hypothetical protein